MTWCFELPRRVEFNETDMAGIAHFANFFRWMEATEHAFVRSLGHDVHRNDDRGMFGFARVHAECDYRAPLRYPEPFVVRLAVFETGTRTVDYEFAFVRGGGADEEVARGRLRVIAVARAAGEHEIRSCAIPTELGEALRRAK